MTKSARAPRATANAPLDACDDPASLCPPSRASAEKVRVSIHELRSIPAQGQAARPTGMLLQAEDQLTNAQAAETLAPVRRLMFVGPRVQRSPPVTGSCDVAPAARSMAHGARPASLGISGFGAADPSASYLIGTSSTTTPEVGADFARARSPVRPQDVFDRGLGAPAQAEQPLHRTCIWTLIREAEGSKLPSGAGRFQTPRLFRSTPGSRRDRLGKLALLPPTSTKARPTAALTLSLSPARPTAREHNT